MAKVGFNNGVFTALQSVVDPQAAADGVVQYNESGVAKWRHGNKESDDSWRLSQGSALGTNDFVFVNVNGEIAFPLQSAFAAYNSTVRSNVTGAGTGYTVIFNTENYDQNGDFDGVSTFTAPITCKYSFAVNVLCTNVAAGHTTGYSTITRTAIATYYGQECSPGAGKTSANLFTLAQYAEMPLIAGDTVTAAIVMDGSTATVGVDPSATATYFSGKIIC